MSAKQLVWFITGTSSGFGRDLTLAALKRGDKVIATARGRSFSKIEDLKRQGANILELDVTAPLEELHQVAKKAVQIYGRVDVVVNNAGYIEAGTLEELTPEETYKQFDTNVFGPLNINRAFLPYMRERKAGTMVWIGSLGGWRESAGGGMYNATKYAARCLAESLHVEIEHLGLRSLCIEPGFFRTEFLSDEHRGTIKTRISDYKDIHNNRIGAYAQINGNQRGDPRKGAEVIVDLVRGEGYFKDKPVPLTLGLGSDAYHIIKDAIEGKLRQLEEYKEIMYSTDLPEGA